MVAESPEIRPKKNESLSREELHRISRVFMQNPPLLRLVALYLLGDNLPDIR